MMKLPNIRCPTLFNNTYVFLFFCTANNFYFTFHARCKENGFSRFAFQASWSPCVLCLKALLTNLTPSKKMA